MPIRCFRNDLPKELIGEITIDTKNPSLKEIKRIIRVNI
jgi:hypothetical protein